MKKTGVELHAPRETSNSSLAAAFLQIWHILQQHEEKGGNLKKKKKKRAKLSIALVKGGQEVKLCNIHGISQYPSTHPTGSAVLSWFSLPAVSRPLQANSQPNL